MVAAGTPELVQAMDEGKIAIATAALVAEAPARTQQRILELDDPRQIRQAAAAIRLGRKQPRSVIYGTAPCEPAERFSGKLWHVTTDLSPAVCTAVIARPPFERGAKPLAPDELRRLTQEWCSRWSVCGADHFAVFWRSEQLFEGQRWLDDCLAGYEFQQLLICQSAAPGDSAGLTFARCWLPVFLYRRAGLSRRRRSLESGLPDLLCRSKAGDDRSGHATQWLVRGASRSLATRSSRCFSAMPPALSPRSAWGGAIMGLPQTQCLSPRPRKSWGGMRDEGWMRDEG